MDAQTKIYQQDRVAARVIDGHAVIVTVDERKLHTLNEVGTFVWERADGKTISQIAKELVDVFDVQPERALSDIQTFVSELHRLGALRLGEATSEDKT